MYALEQPSLAAPHAYDHIANIVIEADRYLEVLLREARVRLEDETRKIGASGFPANLSNISNYSRSQAPLLIPRPNRNSTKARSRLLNCKRDTSGL